MPGRRIFMGQRHRRENMPQDVVVRSRLLVYAALGRARFGTISADVICRSGRICRQLYISLLISGAQRPYKGC